MELYVLGALIYIGAAIACSQKIINTNKQASVARIHEELEQHNMKMKLLKMQREREILEGKNKCHNVSIKDLL